MTILYQRGLDFIWITPTNLSAKCYLAMKSLNLRWWFYDVTILWRWFCDVFL